MNEVRTSLLEALSNPAEIITLVNRLNFGQCTYLLSVYRLESLRVSSDPSKFYSIFDYLEDKAIEKDKAGKEELFLSLPFTDCALYYDTSKFGGIIISPFSVIVYSRTLVCAKRMQQSTIGKTV